MFWNREREYGFNLGRFLSPLLTRKASRKFKLFFILSDNMLEKLKRKKTHKTKQKNEFKLITSIDILVMYITWPH